MFAIERANFFALLSVVGNEEPNGFSELKRQETWQSF